MDNYLEILKQEFEGTTEDSFLIQLRCNFYWDKEAFLRLITAMQICCEQNAANDKLERWQADGFFILNEFVKGLTSHPEFRKPYLPEYYEKAYRRLSDLANYFFSGHSPYIEGTGFEPLEDNGTSNLFEDLS
jgi:hypothetical protein